MQAESGLSFSTSKKDTMIFPFFWGHTEGLRKGEMWAGEAFASHNGPHTGRTPSTLPGPSGLLEADSCLGKDDLA